MSVLLGARFFEVVSLCVPDCVCTSFDRLPADSGLKAARPFRFRRYAVGEYRDSRFRWLGNRPFFQPAEVNRYAGGTDRHFEPIESGILGPVENLVIRPLVTRSDRPSFEIGVHQIRITAVDDQPGLPAPEGIHRDGFDFVAILVIARKNTSGGITSLGFSERETNFIFQQTLPPGSGVLFDDRRLVHYTTPIVPEVAGSPAMRDVFVVSYQVRP